MTSSEIRLHIDVDTTVREYTKLIDRLSSFGHDIEKSFGLPPEEAEREAMDALDTFDWLATSITERHESLLSEAANAAKDALADEIFGQVQSELDILSTHSTVDGVHLESLTITSLDSNRILFEGDGSLDVRLQYGSDADVARDDGAVSYASCKAWAFLAVQDVCAQRLVRRKADLELRNKSQGKQKERGTTVDE
jgi:hypothetical protein